MGIKLHIDVLMAQRKIGAGELAERIGITPANLSILKNDKARAIRFSTLAALCRELDCQPGDLLEFDNDYRDDNSNDGNNGDGSGNSGTSGTNDADASNAYSTSTDVNASS